MATHSSILAWRIPWTEGASMLRSTGSQRVGGDSAHMHTLLGDVLGFPGSPSFSNHQISDTQAASASQHHPGTQSSKGFGQEFPEVGDDKAARAHLPGRSLWVVSAGWAQLQPPEKERHCQRILPLQPCREGRVRARGWVFTYGGGDFFLRDKVGGMGEASWLWALFLLTRLSPVGVRNST